MPFLSLIPFDLIRKLLPFIAITLVIGGGYFYISSLKNTIEDQKQSIATLTLENQSLKDNEVKLKIAISAQNEAIEKNKVDYVTNLKTYENKIAVLNSRITAVSTVASSNFKKWSNSNAGAANNCDAILSYIVGVENEKVNKFNNSNQ